jgi:Ras-related protein Rab-18
MKVSKDRGLSMAQQHGMMFMECSAKSNVGIQRAFEELSEKILERLPSPGVSNAGLNVGASNDSASYLGCGC